MTVVLLKSCNPLSQTLMSVCRTVFARMEALALTDLDLSTVAVLRGGQGLSVKLVSLHSTPVGLRVTPELII